MSGASGSASGLVAPAGLSAARLLRLARGFSCVFWSLPWLSLAHVLALAPFLRLRGMFVLLLLPFVPLAYGLWLLRTGGEVAPRWDARVGRVSLLALAGIYLCPFLAWWHVAPGRVYFAANAAGHFFVMIGVLAGLNRLAAECARRLGDAVLRREALAGLFMVLWLSACTVASLLWLFHRAGVLAAGLAPLLAQLGGLPREARYLFLLPYAMTAFVLWRAKETAFRRAAGGAP